jgi:hypothetical protein
MIRRWVVLSSHRRVGESQNHALGDSLCVARGVDAPAMFDRIGP